MISIPLVVFLHACIDWAMQALWLLIEPLRGNLQYDPLRRSSTPGTEVQLERSLKTTAWGFREIDCLIDLIISRKPPLQRVSSPSTTYLNVKNESESNDAKSNKPMKNVSTNIKDAN